MEAEEKLAETVEDEGVVVGLIKDVEMMTGAVRIVASATLPPGPLATSARLLSKPHILILLCRYHS